MSSVLNVLLYENQSQLWMSSSEFGCAECCNDAMALKSGVILPYAVVESTGLCVCVLISHPSQHCYILKRALDNPHFGNPPRSSVLTTGFSYLPVATS